MKKKKVNTRHIFSFSYISKEKNVYFLISSIYEISNLQATLSRT